MYVLLATAMPSRVVFAGFDDDVETILFLEVFVTKLRNCLITSPCFPPFAPQNILLRYYSEVFFAKTSFSQRSESTGVRHRFTCERLSRLSTCSDEKISPQALSTPHKM